MGPPLLRLGYITGPKRFRELVPNPDRREDVHRHPPFRHQSHKVRAQVSPGPGLRSHGRSVRDRQGTSLAGSIRHVRPTLPWSGRCHSGATYRGGLVCHPRPPAHPRRAVARGGRRHRGHQPAPGLRFDRSDAEALRPRHTEVASDGGNDGRHDPGRAALDVTAKLAKAPGRRLVGNVQHGVRRCAVRKVLVSPQRRSMLSGIALRSTNHLSSSPSLRVQKGGRSS